MNVNRDCLKMNTCLIYRIRWRIRSFLLEVTLRADEMAMIVASLTDKPAAELAGTHGSRSPAEGTQTDNLGHLVSLPQENEFFTQFL